MMLTLVPVKPSYERLGPGAPLDRFDVIDASGESVLRNARVPIYGSARELIARGVSPAELLEFKHAGSGIVAFRGLAGELARWTVSESKQGLALHEWKPFSEEARAKVRR